MTYKCRWWKNPASYRMIDEGFIYYSYIQFSKWFNSWPNFIPTGSVGQPVRVPSKKIHPPKKSHNRRIQVYWMIYLPFQGCFLLVFRKTYVLLPYMDPFLKTYYKLTTKSNDKTHLDQGAKKDSHPFNPGSCQASGPTSVWRPGKVKWRVVLYLEDHPI